jgi:hypothetical protein
MVYSKLVGLQYKIIYMHGCDNVEADVLSCLLSSLLDTRAACVPMHTNLGAIWRSDEVRQLVHWDLLEMFCSSYPSHSALVPSPFEVLYGHAPWHFGVDSTKAVEVTDLKKVAARSGNHLQTHSTTPYARLCRMKWQVDKLVLNGPFKWAIKCISSCNHMCRPPSHLDPIKSWLSDFYRRFVRWLIVCNCQLRHISTRSSMSRSSLPMTPTLVCKCLYRLSPDEWYVEVVHWFPRCVSSGPA